MYVLVDHDNENMIIDKGRPKALIQTALSDYMSAGSPGGKWSLIFHNDGHYSIVARNMHMSIRKDRD